MAENKEFNLDGNSKNLKNADLKKSQSETAQNNSVRSELFIGNKISDKSLVSDIKVKKKLPLVVDIIAGILMLALVFAIIVGSYMLFRYYSNDYGGVDITYTVAFDPTDDVNSYHKMKNGELYIDTEDNSIYFGRITGVEMVEGKNAGEQDRVLFTIQANVKYRKGEGYSIDNNKLAVGCTYTLRCVEKNIEVMVVELNPD